MNIPSVWTLDTADIARDEAKRRDSPCSFFYAQGRAIVLASRYFRDDRLTAAARGGVARKHRHRIHLAMFGQLMASFEYFSKEVVARALDISDYLDLPVARCEWIKLSPTHVLATRNVRATPGSILIGPTQGWHSAAEVNKRYNLLFGTDPIPATQESDLDRLWILRHSVAHNAGLVTNHDASRIGIPALSERVAAINDAFIEEAFEFLSPIAASMATTAGASLIGRLRAEIAVRGKSYPRDEALYRSIKLLCACIGSRTQSLPTFGEPDYNADFPDPAP